MKRIIGSVLLCCVSVFSGFTAAPAATAKAGLVEALNQRKIQDYLARGLQVFLRTQTAWHGKWLATASHPYKLGFPVSVETDRLDPVWRESGPKLNIGFFRAKLPSPVKGISLVRVGDVFHFSRGAAPLPPAILFMENPVIFQKPTSFQKVAELPTAALAPDALGKPQVTSGETLFFWNPVPPRGFVGIGCVVTLASTPPSVDLIRCVKEELAVPGEFSEPVCPAGLSHAWLWRQNPGLTRIPSKLEEFRKYLDDLKKMLEIERKTFREEWVESRLKSLSGKEQTDLRSLFAGFFKACDALFPILIKTTVEDHKKALRYPRSIQTGTFLAGGENGFPATNVLGLAQWNVGRGEMPWAEAQFWQQRVAGALKNGNLVLEWRPDQKAAMRDILTVQNSGREPTPSEILAAFDSPPGKKWMSDPQWRLNLREKKAALDLRADLLAALDPIFGRAIDTKRFEILLAEMQKEIAAGKTFGAVLMTMVSAEGERLNQEETAKQAPEREKMLKERAKKHEEFLKKRRAEKRALAERLARDKRERQERRGAIGKNREENREKFKAAIARFISEKGGQ